ncbi:MAG: DUF4241 domain-containing protein [Saprospiraceae bacterium]|nr:DUF4241 domain-containing protein [Saprospiraceae bacterium]
MRSFFFLIILILTSCQIKKNDSDKVVNSNIVYDKNDSIPQFKLPDSTLIYPELFEGAFLNGSEVKQWGFTMKFYCKKIGKLKISSGKIIAEDPVALNKDSKPYIHKFPKGDYPIEIARLINPKGYEGNAFTRIRFSSNKISKWEYALLENQKKMPITNLDGYGYGVDAGIGLYIDQEAVIEFSKVLQEKWENLFIDQFEDQYLIYEFGKHNVATFSTGAGDGFYRTYVGYDEDGNICQLLTDFELVKWW